MPSPNSLKATSWNAPTAQLSRILPMPDRSSFDYIFTIILSYSGHIYNWHCFSVILSFFNCKYLYHVCVNPFKQNNSSTRISICLNAPWTFRKLFKSHLAYYCCLRKEKWRQNICKKKSHWWKWVAFSSSTWEAPGSSPAPPARLSSPTGMSLFPQGT